MVYCVAVSCGNNTNKAERDGSKISFHRFPSNKKMKKRWIDAVGRTSLPRHLYLCSEHFTSDCFTDSYRLKSKMGLPGLATLNTDACPTIFPPKSAKKPNLRLSSEIRAEIKSRKEVNV